jgi:hypothetical protein
VNVDDPDRLGSRARRECDQTFVELAAQVATAYEVGLGWQRQGLAKALEQGQEAPLGARAIAGRRLEDGDQPAALFEVRPDDLRILGGSTADFDARVIGTELVAHQIEKPDPGLVLHGVECPRASLGSRALFR